MQERSCIHALRCCSIVGALHVVSVRERGEGSGRAGKDEERAGREGGEAREERRI